MSTPRHLAALLLACGLGIVGCSADDESDFEPRGTVDSTDQSPSGNPATGDTVVRVDTGRWSDEPMMPTLVDYLEARQESMRERRIVPELVGAATYQWIQQQRVVISDAKQRGWTVPAEAQMRIVGVRPGFADATVRVCMWGPSVDFVDQGSGDPIRPTQRQWYPFDVKMVQVEDRWYVSAAAEGDFACEVDEG